VIAQLKIQIDQLAASVMERERTFL